MMFDAKTDKVLCVIDLDTVMPGFVLFILPILFISSNNPTP